MMLDCVELAKCAVCGTEGPVQRTYYYYDGIYCECCNTPGSPHFEYVCHCGVCKPKAPTRITITAKPTKHRK
jgi:hypothetical protein